MVNARFQCIIAAGIVAVGLQRATQSQEMQQQHDRSIWAANLAVDSCKARRAASDYGEITKKHVVCEEWKLTAPQITEAG